MRELTVLPQLGFTEALSAAWNKIAQFNGRSRRSEYWWTYLVATILNFIFTFVPVIGSLISLLISLALIPITFRRLHDTGRSGWWYGVSLIGGLAFFVFFIFVLIGSLGVSASLSDLSSMSDNEIIEKMLTGVTLGYVAIGLLIGIVYNIILLVFLCQDSHMQDNKYGPSPKYVDMDTNADMADRRYDTM